MTYHLAIYLSKRLKEKFGNQPISLLDIRRHIHHLTRLPNYVIRSLLDDLIQRKLIVFKKVEEKPLYNLDIELTEIKALILSDKNLQLLKRRYNIKDE